MLRAQGHLDQAKARLERALAVAPNDPDALNSYGSLLQASGRAAEASKTFRRVLELRPDLPGGYANLGLALYELGQVSEAVTLYRQGLALRPIAEMYDNLAIALQKQGLIDEAIANYRAALALQPDNVNTQCNLAAALADEGQAQAAAAAYRSILHHHPEHMVAHSNLLFNLSFDEHCSPEQYLAEAQVFSAKAMRAATSSCVPACERPEGRGAHLNVGFVSGDLRVHPVGYFLEGVLRHLDRTRFRLFAYSTVAQEDVLTARLRPLFDGWRSIKGVDDAAAANAIRRDGIDLLIDLGGHTGDNRLPVFAFSPAPVQITWLGYFASTGLASMNYIIADELCVPNGSEGAFSESVYRLPSTRLCFTPPTDGSMPDVSPLPARHKGHLTFGCFQRLPKITPAVLNLWGRIFAAVPQARLFLQSHQTGRKIYVDEIVARLAAVGISSDRVTVRGPAPRTAYLDAYAEVDVVLDTFPYTGGTTTCEAMWMGVPTVTLAGTSMIGRQGVALLTAANLPEWVAQTEEEYVAKAVRAATDVDSLSKLRSRMREQVKESALFDVAAFAGHLGHALESMWTRVPARETDRIGRADPK